MKYVYILVIGIICLFAFLGCAPQNTNANNESISDVSEHAEQTTTGTYVSQASVETDSQEYTPAPGGFKIKASTDFGTFQKPHKCGEALSIEYMPNGVQTVKATAQVREIITGEEARTWLTPQNAYIEDCNYDLEKYTIILMNVYYKSTDFPQLVWGACDSSGNRISEISVIPTVRQASGGYDMISETEWAGWWITLIPKEIKEYTPALFIETLYEPPGRIATFYFELPEATA